MKIFRNYLYNASYQLFIIIVPIITVPYISRVLGPNSIGTNAFTNSIMSYFILIANLGLSLYGNRAVAYARNDSKKMSIVFWEIFFLKIVMMVLSVILFFIFLSFYGKHQNLLIAQSIQLIAVGFDISWFFFGIEEFKKTVIRNVFVKLLSLSLIFMFVKDREDLIVYILINGGATFLGNITLWSYVKKYISKVNFKQIDLLKHANPMFKLFLPQVTTTIFMTINRLLLGNLSTFDQTGFFDNSDKIVRIFLAFITSLGTVVFPRIANYHIKGETNLVNKLISLVFNLVTMISLPLAFGMLTVSEPFSNIFFGNEFHGISMVLSILTFELIFMGWSSIIGQQYMVAINQIKGLTVSMFISIGINIVGSFLLIPRFGALGAAGMSVISEFIIVFVQFVYVRQSLNISNLFKDFYKYFFSTLIMYILCLITRYFVSSYNDFLQISFITIIGVSVYGIMIILFRPTIINEMLAWFKKN